ncbi:MAG: copper chaperone [Planctomycetota bacterium]|nr:MAG: copper chaperone [Planctomycetota bacterium]
MQTTELNIQGMTCGACVRHVETALRGVDGVAQADVELRRARALVQHDPQRAGVEQLVAAVRDAGYAARAGAD